MGAGTLLKNVDLERLGEKAREVVKLHIWCNAEIVGGRAVYYAELKQGSVMYEKRMDPPIELWAEELLVMKPLQLDAHLAAYDDYFKMREEIGLIVLHTRLGNKFSSEYVYGESGSPAIIQKPATTTMATTTPPATTTNPTTTTTTRPTTTTTIPTTTYVEACNYQISPYPSCGVFC